MSTAATEPQVPAVEPAPEVAVEPTPPALSEQPDNPRLRAEREIAARRVKDLEEETGNKHSGEPSALEAADGAPPAQVPAEPPAEPPAPAAEPAPEPVAAKPAFDPDAEVELLINGKPVKVKGSQIIDTGMRALQKDFAADQKLELASKLLDEATKRAQGQPSPQGDAQPAGSAVVTAPAGVTAKSDMELAELLQYGTKEQAAQAIAEIRRRDAKAAPEESVQELLTKHLPAAVSAQLTFHEAIRTAQTEYRDIFADPYLTQLFHIEEHKARQAGDARSHAELYKAIGDSIRDHFKLKAPAAPAGPTLDEKKAAKAATPPAPRLASVRLDKAPDPKEPSREDILAKMKSTRGQGKLNPYSNR